MDASQSPPSVADRPLAIGCFASMCRARLADLMLAFARACPDVAVGVQEMGRPALLPALRAGRIDLAIQPGDADHGPALRSAELWRDRVVAVMALGDPLSAGETVSPASLSRRLVLAPREPNGAELHRFLVQRGMADAPAPCAAILDLDPARMLDRVAEGDGVMLACASHADADPRLSVRPLAGSRAMFAVRAYWTPADPGWPLSELIGLL